VKFTIEIALLNWFCAQEDMFPLLLSLFHIYVHMCARAQCLGECALNIFSTFHFVGTFLSSSVFLCLFLSVSFSISLLFFFHSVSVCLFLSLFVFLSRYVFLCFFLSLLSFCLFVFFLEMEKIC
jgi:hypothetical protein